MSSGYQSARTSSSGAPRCFRRDIRATRSPTRTTPDASTMPPRVSSPRLRRCPQAQSLFSGPQLPVLPRRRGGRGVVYGANASTAAGQLIPRPICASSSAIRTIANATMGRPSTAPGPRSTPTTADARPRSLALAPDALEVCWKRRPDLAELDLSGEQRRDDAAVHRSRSRDPGSAGLGSGIGLRVPARRHPRGPDRTYAFDAELDQGRVPDALADDIASWAAAAWRATGPWSAASHVRTAAGATINSWLVRDQPSGIRCDCRASFRGAYLMRAYPQSVRHGRRLSTVAEDV